MDPIVIGGLITLGGYIFYRNRKPPTENKVLMEPSKYHELCTKINSCETIFDVLLEKYRKKIKTSFVISEPAFQYLFISPQKKLLLFYKTLFDSINKDNVCVGSKMFVDKNFDVSFFKEIHEIDNRDNILKYVHEISQVNGNGNVLIGKCTFNEKLRNAFEHKNMIYITGSTNYNDKTNFYNIMLNDKYSLTLFPEECKFDKKWIFEQYKNSDQKIMTIGIPQMDFNSLIDLKRLELLKDIFSRELKQIDNVYLFTSVTFEGQQYNNEDLSKVTTFTKFNFVIYHKPSNQIILFGKFRDS